MSCGANVEGLTLLVAINENLNVSMPYVDVTGALFQIPATALSDMYQEVQEPSNADMTSGVVDGTGTFDVLMASINAHLKDQFDRGRITGAEYTKAYIALTQSAMATAAQFVLTKPQAFWQAQQAQVATINGRIKLETSRVEHSKAQYETETAGANFAIATLKLANESQQFCVYKFQLENLFPAQVTQIEEQIRLTQEQVEVQRAQTLDTRSDTTTITGLVGKQKDLLSNQINLIDEQTEVQRAQTLDTRSDTATVVGLVGKQKALYTQQITSYERDAQTKAAKLFTDAWVTQKTIDEGLTAPAGFTNASLDEVLTAIKTANNLD